MNEDVVSALPLNEAKTLGIVKPLNGAFFFHKPSPETSGLVLCANTRANKKSRGFAAFTELDGNHFTSQTAMTLNLNCVRSISHRN